MSHIINDVEDDQSQVINNSLKAKLELEKLIKTMYYEWKPFNGVTAKMHKHFEQLKNEKNLIEIFDICLRDYASELLQEFTPENFQQVEILWEIHFKLQTISFKTEKLFQFYRQLYLTEPPQQYDFFDIHFKHAKKILPSLPESREVHSNYKKQFFKSRNTLVKILNDTNSPKKKNTESNQTKIIQKNSQQTSKTQPSINVRNEIKEFEDRLSKLENNMNKLETNFPPGWVQKYKSLFMKRKK